MVFSNVVPPAPYWLMLTRLGEAQILLPALLLATVLLWRQRGGGAPAAWWLGGTLVAALITTVTKVAFIGWGLGWAALDFTGISGHAMFAAAVLPLMLRLALGGGSGHAALAAGYVLAFAVGVSRCVVGAHSASEVIAGLALGGAVAPAVLWAGHLPPVRLARWAPAVLAAWALVAVAGAPPSRSHDAVTRLALRLSGHDQPYKRWQMHRDYRAHASASMQRR